jgi:coatomer protein complex subunit alpha (xenin)
LTAASFARRILDIAPSGQFADAAKQVIQFAEKTPSDSVKVVFLRCVFGLVSLKGNVYQLEYDERNPFSVCCGSLVPIYKGSESVSCSFCKSKYLPRFKDSVCSVCLVSKVGANATGMVISNFK